MGGARFTQGTGEEEDGCPQDFLQGPRDGPVRLEIQSRAVGIQKRGTSLPTGNQGDIREEWALIGIRRLDMMCGTINNLRYTDGYHPYGRK